MAKSVLVLVLCFLVLSNAQSKLGDSAENSCLPNQIHLGLGDAYFNSLYNYNQTASRNALNSSAMITWQTKENCSNTYIQLKSEGLDFSKILSYSDLWNDRINDPIPEDSEDVNNGEDDTGKIYTSYSYTALFNELQPGVNYTYYIFQNGTKALSQDEDTPNYAGPYTFSLPSPQPVDQPATFLVYGDIDTFDGNDTIKALRNYAKNITSQFVGQLCLGDLGYNIYSEVGLRGEYFFNSMQNLSANVPFMMTPGNHEWRGNYSFLSFRMKMPIFKQSNNHYFSFNVGKMHFIGANYIFYDDESQEEKDRMLAWLRNDLEVANASRKERPWIIVFSHYPIYCSYNNYSEQSSKCSNYYGKFKVFDELWYQYRVDLVLASHVHYWERMGPIYNNQSQPYFQYDWDTNKNYIINPQAPIYTVDGASGNHHSMMSNPTPPLNYSIRISAGVGFSTLSYINESCLLYKHISSANLSTVDYFYIQKGSEYPYPRQPTPAREFRSQFWIIFSVGLIAAIIIFMVCFGYRSHKNVTENDMYKQVETGIAFTAL